MKQNTVCILAAGAGSRMDGYTKHLPKALVEVDGQAAISHIIQAFPHDFKFVVATGHKSNLVEEYLSIRHPDRQIICVPVPSHSGPGSGPGTSALSCAAHLPDSFFLACCDTLWSEPVSGLRTDTSWIGICPVPQEAAPNYCNVRLNSDGRVTEFLDKEPVPNETFQAFVGLAFIKDPQPFFHALSNAATGEKETQLTSGFRALAREHGIFGIPIPSWVDIGTEAKLRAYKNFLGTRAFAKHGEEIYLSPDGVIKFFSDPEIVANRVDRAGRLAGLVPKITDQTRNFYRYEFVAGATFYEKGSPERFERLLQWLERHLWKPVSGVGAEEFQMRARRFYLEKTRQRLAPFFGSDKTLEGRILALAESPGLLNGPAIQFHGDLNLANILIREEKDEFLLLDWRQDFGGSTVFGDLGYDLAKLLVSIRIDFSKLAEAPAAKSASPSKHSRIYEGLLLKFIARKGMERQRIELIASLILLNMAGIHAAPLDEVFFRLGLESLGIKKERKNASLGAQAA